MLKKIKMISEEMETVLSAFGTIKAYFHFLSPTENVSKKLSVKCSYYKRQKKTNEVLPRFLEAMEILKSWDIEARDKFFAEMEQSKARYKDDDNSSL